MGPCNPWWSTVKDVTDKNFGVIIAFWLPGFLLLWGLSYTSDQVAVWLVKSSATDAPTVGGFLYAALASLALGLLISAIRWLIIDHFLFWFTCLQRPTLDFSHLKDKDAFAAFNGIVENHYRYYQYYANTLVAIVAAFIFYARSEKGPPTGEMWIIGAVIGLALLLAARDCLKNYYVRAKEILS